MIGALVAGAFACAEGSQTWSGISPAFRPKPRSATRKSAASTTKAAAASLAVVLLAAGLSCGGDGPTGPALQIIDDANRRAIGQGDFHRRQGLGLNADDFDFGVQCLQHQSDPGDQTAAAHRNEDGVDGFAVLAQDFHAHGALAGDDLGIGLGLAAGGLADDAQFLKPRALSKLVLQKRLRLNPRPVNHRISIDHFSGARPCTTVFRPMVSGPLLS